MKVKTLRNKETKEFVHIDVHQNLNFTSVGTSETPRLLPMSSDLDGMIEYFNHKGIEVDWNNIEMVELDVIESGEIGADIRNKLGSPTNLLAMLKLYFKEEDADRIRTLEMFIKKEMEVSEISLKYVANLL